jgi:CheY-like chemotaxis protein
MNQWNTVLLVDDDPASSFLSMETLEAMAVSNRILTIFNGEEALLFVEQHCFRTDQKLSAACPMLILLDINMPVMNGFEFLEKFCQLPASFREGVKIVLLTTSTRETDRMQARKYHVKHYLEKPLTPEKLFPIL